MSKKKIPDSPTKHERILEVAGQMFMAHGFSAVSMDAIAEAAPVSKPTLYNHFSDKKALFVAVMGQRCRGLFSQLQQSLQDGADIEDVLMSIGRQFLSLILEANALSIYRVVITEAQTFPELGKLFYESGPKRSRALLADYLKTQHEAKVIDAPDAELAANIFFGMLTSRYQMQSLLGLKKQVSAKEREETIKYIVKVFLGGVKR